MRRTKRYVCGALGVFLCAMPAAAQSHKVTVVRNLDYVADVEYADGKDRLDLYIPAGVANAPVIFSLHGGALSAGDRAEEVFVGQRFAAAGYLTVVTSYRLSPQVSHPAHIQDAAAAFAWVKRNIRQHGGDPDRIIVIGHSAGAYLGMLLATDSRYLAAHKLSSRDIKGVVPVSGFFWVDKPGVAPDRPTYVWGTDRKVWIESSPSRYLRADLPPVLLLDTDGDEAWRQQQNVDMAAALRGAGHKDVTVHKVRGRSHMSVWTEMGDGESEETSSWILRFAQRVLAAQAPAGKAEAGKVFWQGQMCSFCHGSAGDGGWGPDLAGRALTLAQFTRATRQPWGLMPAYTDTQVSDQSLADLHAFLTSLPAVAQPAAPRWRHTPPGAPEGQRLQSAFGCSQCHSPELLVPRAWLLSIDRPGAVPDDKFGVSKDAGFPYFAKMVYDHSQKYPKGTMGDFSRERLPEAQLREIYTFMLDAGLRVRMEAALAVGMRQGNNTTYTLTVGNLGRPSGPAIEDVTIFVRIPAGATVVSATGAGYKGVRPLAQLGLQPALQAAPGAFAAGLPERPAPDLTRDVAVWEVRRIAAVEKQVYTLTLAGAPPTAGVIQGFAGSTVYWARPAPKAAALQLAYRDLRVPEKGDHFRILLPSPPPPD